MFAIVHSATTKLRWSSLFRQQRLLSIRKHVQLTDGDQLPQDVLPVHFVPKGQAPPPLAPSRALEAFQHKLGEKQFVYEKENVALLVGLGDADKIDEQAIRKATHAAMIGLEHFAEKPKSAVLHVPSTNGLATARILELMTQASGRHVSIVLWTRMVTILVGRHVVQLQI